MTPGQVAVVAKCLGVSPRVVAASRTEEVADGVTLVISNVRGAGSVLVGRDLSILYFASHIPPGEAAEAWRSGRRTPPSQFRYQVESPCSESDRLKRRQDEI
jgi:hypothetical protein